MAYIVAEPCIKCKYTDCVEVCPVNCFYEGVNFLVIHPDECIDCGACEPVCPENAIYYEADLTPDLVPAKERAREVFVPLGQLGGARRHGPLGFDHPHVAALPPAEG